MINVDYGLMNFDHIALLLCVGHGTYSFYSRQILCANKKIIRGGEIKARSQKYFKVKHKVCV